MEVQFNHSVCTALRPILCETASSEQTQELRLSEGMPDVGRVIGVWGQSILRSKEWNAGQLQCAAGMMVWILYAPEDGSEPRMVNTWIPFQLRWDLPEGAGEGTMHIQCLTRLADARSVSPRKILVRAGLSGQVQAYVQEKMSIASPEKEEAGLALLRRKYPLRLRKEAGEKTFSLDEELTLPDSAPQLDSVVYYALEPKAQEVRVLSDKLVFKGGCKLHILYRSKEGQLHSWDFSMPFSQYALLDTAYGSDAQGELSFGVTNLEPELQDNGTLRVKCGLVCQYVIHDRELLEVVEDAYCLGHELEIEREALEIPVILEQRRENLYPEQNLPADANVAADVRYLPDFPRMRRETDGVTVQWPGVFQVLYYGQDGALHTANSRWEGEQKLPVDGDANLWAVPENPEAQASAANGSINLSAQLPTAMQVSTDQRLQQLTRIRQGQARKPDPDRPSLILQRSGRESLWEMAKKNGSTVEAIREANGLQEEPIGERMLLIPIL